MNRLARGLLVALALLAGACAQRPSTYVVLLDQPGGSPGAVTFSTQGGQAVLDQPNGAVGADRAATPPGKPFALTAQEIATTFGGALAAEPRRPQNFALFFNFGSNELTAESKVLLPKVLEAIAVYPAPEVAIVGHTDSVGNPDANYRLGLTRAEAIRDQVVGIGVDRRIIQVDSHGTRNPLVPTPAGRPEPRNRRVEITVR